MGPDDQAVAGEELRMSPRFLFGQRCVMEPSQEEGWT